MSDEARDTGRRFRREPSEPIFGEKVEPPKEDPFVGKMYGKWKLTERIGVGGVGFVYLGKNTDTGKTAAVKLLQEGFGSNPTMRARFKREGDIAVNRLKHPNIMVGHLMGEQAGIQYLVMEFIDGETLEEIMLREKKIPVDRVVRIMDDVLNALQHTHQKGITHRDLKPANIMISKVGRLKLIDYGLAKLDDAAAKLTVVGQIMGSVYYMSPEQSRGQRGDPKSDLYACGVLMYAMLTSKLPFTGKNPAEVLSKHINGSRPSVRELNADVSPALEGTVHRLLSKEPENRYSDAKEAARSIRAAMQDETKAGIPAYTPKDTPKRGTQPSLPPPRDKSSLDPKLIAMGVVVLMLLVVILILVLR